MGDGHPPSHPFGAGRPRYGLVAAPSQKLIHHSDQGSQYTSLAFGLRSKKAGVRSSRGTVGNWFDNDLCGSFFASVECELLDGHRFCTFHSAQRALFESWDGTIHIADIQRWHTTHPQPTRTTTNLGIDSKALNCTLNRGNSTGRPRFFLAGNLTHKRAKRCYATTLLLQ